MLFSISQSEALRRVVVNFVSEIAEAHYACLTMFEPTGVTKHLAERSLFDARLDTPDGFYDTDGFERHP